MGRFSRDMWAIWVLGALCLAIFSPVLFLGKVFSNEEQYGFYYVISHYVKDSLQSGTSLLWNSAYYGGVSASLDQFVGAWYPLNRILFVLFDSFTAHHISIFLATFSGLLLAYWFGRLQGWLRSSAVIFALSYLLATTFAWIQIGTIAAHSFLILPAILIALYYASERKTFLPPVLLGGIALGIGFLAGFVQIVFYAYIICGLYALFLAARAYRRGVSLLESAQVCIVFSFLTIVGFIVGFRQFFPSAYFIDLTIRTGDYAVQNAFVPSPTELIAFILPNYFSIPYLSGGGSPGFYVGALGLVFAFLGVFFYRTSSVSFFSLLYLCIAGFAFRVPIFSWLNEHVPPFSHMGGNFRWMVAASLPLAYLVGAGADGFIRNPEKIGKKGKIFALIFSSGVAAALFAGSVTLAFISRFFNSFPESSEYILRAYSTFHPLSLPLEHYQPLFIEAVSTTANLFSLGNVKFAFGVVLWLIGFIFFALLFRSTLARLKIAPAAIAIMTVTVLGTFALQFDALVPRTLFETKPQLVKLLEARESDPNSYRIMGFLIGDGLYEKAFSKKAFDAIDTALLQREMLVNNSSLYFGIDRMDGMEPYRTLRHNQLLHTVLAYDKKKSIFDKESPALRSSSLTKLENTDVMKQVSFVEKMEDARSKIPLLSMMNVKYLYSVYPIDDSRLSLQGVVRVPLSKEVEPRIYLYENRIVLPRIYFAQHPVFATKKDIDVLQDVARTTDFSKITWIECDTCKDVDSSFADDRLEVLKYENGDVKIATHTKHSRWLVFSESFMSGWVATVDGKRTDIFKANYLFQSIFVPPGKHEIVFSYHDIVNLKLKNFFEITY